MAESFTYHIVHDRHDNPGRYMVARESETEVRYWSDVAGDWVYYPDGTRYSSKQAGGRKLNSMPAPSEEKE